MRVFIQCSHSFFFWMKLATFSLLSLIASASAFVAPNAASKTAALNAEAKEKVPCFGATPLIGEPTFLGETYWDKLTMEYGSAETGKFIRAAELKHGRSAMLATVGFAFHKLGITLNNISPHEYLSVTQNIKFADLAAMTPLDAMKSLPVESLTQMFVAIAAVEIYELTHVDGKIAEGERVAPGLQAGGLTGDLGWNPLNIQVTDRRKLVELQNGRAAMFAISAWVAADAVPGSVPLNLPW